jgi:hypothetical protein|tara:strand:- start:554 stop:868 length:315 start_codon:yes stop_codon:yes gene_type:complete
MYKLFTTTPLEFKKHCITVNNIKQEELNTLVDIRDKYITNISTKRKDFENQYEDYMMKYSDASNYIEKVNLFKTLYPIKKKHYNIYTYENYFELKELNETETKI